MIKKRQTGKKSKNMCHLDLICYLPDLERIQFDDIHQYKQTSKQTNKPVKSRLIWNTLPSNLMKTH